MSNRPAEDEAEEDAFRGTLRVPGNPIKHEAWRDRLAQLVIEAVADDAVDEFAFEAVGVAALLAQQGNKEDATFPRDRVTFVLLASMLFKDAELVASKVRALVEARALLKRAAGEEAPDD